MSFFVYILASQRNGTLYVGMTDDLVKRIRERQIKKWNRVWKLELIEKSNPSWRDLYEEIAI
jgi:putative endonuclease